MNDRLGTMVRAQAHRLAGFAHLLARYGGALGLVGGAFLLWQALLSVLDILPPHTVFLPMLMAATLFFGLRAGLLATVSAALLLWYATPVGQLRIEVSRGWVATALFVAAGILVNVVAFLYQWKQAEEALRKSEASLKEANQRKNEFLAMLSHELRNPLAPIRNSLYILERATPGGDQAKRAQRTIDRQTTHMTHLIGDLVEATRVSRGTISLQRERLDLCDLVRRTVEDHRSVFAQEGVQLDLHVVDRHLWVNGDPTRLEQVLGNLLQNAAKFTARGGATWVSVERDESANEALIRVCDTGIGVSAAMLARLFEPLAQADTTLDRRGGGLGLGLSVVKGLVELHGGKVDASSAGEGRGAAFTVRLPLQRQEMESVPSVQSARLHRQRVLVIEDNVDAAESLKEALGLSGHEVVVALDGFQGIAKAREFKPEVVLCDVGLPGMDGYQVARAFRADETLKGAFLVALTGYAGPEDQQRAAEAGFARHLAKPASLQTLEEVIASQLS